MSILISGAYMFYIVGVDGRYGFGRISRGVQLKAKSKNDKASRFNIYAIQLLIMTEKLNIIVNLSEQDSFHIDAFLDLYGANVKSLVLKNGGNEQDIKALLTGLISDLYLKNKEGFDYSKYDLEPLVMTLCIVLFKKRRKEKYKNTSPLLIEQSYYEPNRIKLSSDKYNKIKEDYESILEEIGEPGRTILKLTFNDRETDQAIVDHLHFDTIEKLNSIRTKLLDRCIENLLL